MQRRDGSGVVVTLGMVRHGKPGIMLDRIFSETKLRNGESAGGDGYFVRTTDGKRIGPMSGANRRLR